MELSQTDADDRALVASTLQGDKTAFDRLWSRHYSLLWKIATRMVRDESSAKDLLQETCLRSYLGIRRLADPCLFRSWSIGILLNVYREWRSNRENHSMDVDSLYESAGGVQFLELSIRRAPREDPALLFESRELRRLLLDSVMRLPSRLRKAALLFYFEGMDIRQAAAALGVTPQALKMRLSRARARLRNQLR